MGSRSNCIFPSFSGANTNGFLKINYKNEIKETNNTYEYELMRMVAATLQHVGQINYIKGIVENKIWYTGNINEKR